MNNVYRIAVFGENVHILNVFELVPRESILLVMR